MVKDLTISGLHLGRVDLLAEQPKVLRVEWQNLQQAAAALLLQLPPKSQHQSRKEKRGNRKRGQGNENARRASGYPAAVQEMGEMASAFLTDYVERIEEVDVVALLARLKDKEAHVSSKSNSTEDAPAPAPFIDKDTFEECRRRYEQLKQGNGELTAISCVSRIWASLVKALERRQRLGAGLMVATATALAAASIFFTFARRSQL